MVGACQGGVVVANDARWKLVAMSTQNFRPGQWEYMGFVGVLKVESSFLLGNMMYCSM